MKDDERGKMNGGRVESYNRAGRFRQCSFFTVAVSVGATFFFAGTSYADLYFAPGLIAADQQMVADLSRFEKAGAQLPGNYQVDIYVNGKIKSSQRLSFIDRGSSQDDDEGSKKNVAVRDNTGLMACLTLAELEDLGVNPLLFPPLSATENGQCTSPGLFIQEAFTTFDFQHMRLDLSIPQVAMKNSARGYIQPERWDEGINAFMLNYNLSGSNSHAQYGNSRSHYLQLNSGINLGPWRLRDNRTWNEYDSQSYSVRKWQHVKTYAERAIIPLRSVLTAGDTTTSGDVFDSLGFRGIQLATDDSMYPDSLRGFAPVVRGTASTNARVDIRQNGYTVYQTFVSPGAFAINDLFPVYSSGDLEVTVTEADGSLRSFTVPYSSVPVLQREGRLKYSLNAGRYQAASDSYSQPQFVQGTLVWGLPHNITTYGGMQYSQNYLSVLSGAGFNLGPLGALSADITHASSTLADGNTYQGQSVRFLYARSLNELGTTFQLTGYRYSTKGFHTLDETALKGMKGWRYEENSVDREGKPVKQPYTDYYNLYNNRRAKIQASISQRVGDLGSIYLSGVRQTYWNKSGASDSLQAGFNSSLGSINYSLTYNYNRDTNQPGSDRSAFLSLSVPLDALLSSDTTNRRRSVYATYSASRSSDEKISHQAGISGTALKGSNLGWNISQGFVRSEGNNGSLSAHYQGSYGSSNLGYSYSNNYRQVSYGMAGSALLHSDGLTFGQAIGETAVLVAAPGLSDVIVENETGVRTDWRGYTIKPYASVYRENRVALDMASLDDYAEIDNAVSRVVPTRGAVVRAAFKGYTGRRVLMTLTYHGQPLPFGTMVTAGERGGIVGDAGQVYLSGMPDEGIVQAEWGDGDGMHCSVPYRLEEKAGGQPVVRVNGMCR